MNNSQVAHAWAAQVKRSGRTSNGNFSFDGPSLYSYSTEIARFVTPEIVVYTLQTYSVTTTGKHKFLNAISQKQAFGISCHMRDIPHGKTWAEIAPIIFREQLERLEERCRGLKNQRTRLDWSLGQIELSALDAEDFYYEWNTLGLPFTDFIADIDALEELQQDASAYILAHLQIDLRAKIEKQAASLDAAEKRKKEAQANQLAQAAEELIAWREHRPAIASFLHMLPVALRMSASNLFIDTSHGATIPIQEAVKLHAFLSGEKELPGLMVDQFKVDRIDCYNKTIVIGCHKIPLSEIDLIAKALSLPPVLPRIEAQQLVQ